MGRQLQHRRNCVVRKYCTWWSWGSGTREPKTWLSYLEQDGSCLCDTYLSWVSFCQSNTFHLMKFCVCCKCKWRSATAEGGKKSRLKVHMVLLQISLISIGCMNVRLHWSDMTTWVWKPGGPSAVHSKWINVAQIGIPQAFLLPLKSKDI